MIRYEIVSLTCDQTYLQLLMINDDTKKIIYDNYKLIFVMISFQISTLTYDQSYLRLLMLKNGTRTIIYDNYNLVFSHYKLYNDKIIPNKH